MIKCWKTKASDSEQFMIANKPQPTPGWLSDHVTIENQEGYFMTAAEIEELYQAAANYVISRDGGMSLSEFLESKGES